MEDKIILPKYEKSDFLQTQMPYDFLYEIYISDKFLFSQVFELMKDYAISINVKNFPSMWKNFLHKNKNINTSNTLKLEDFKSKNFIQLEKDDNDKTIKSIENFLRVMRNDDFFKNVKFNLLSYSPEIIENEKIRKWTDSDDSKAKHYIEKKYKLHNESKYQDAIRILFSEREYHPVKDIIEKIQWDKKPRIKKFLQKWIKCEISEYTEEVSRLIFAGGIHRLYNPGCKFDDVPVLIGTKQGEGKSTFVEWLAIENDFYGTVSEIDGQKGIEALEGLWICEIDEMLATTKAKEVEAVKSYITRKNDRYRRPYERRTSEHPRQCVFIGTTNKRQFLTDKTGNRRFYPVIINQNGYDLFDSKKEIQEEVKQCWAEALELFRQNKLKPYANRDLKPIIIERQNDSVEEDWRIEKIRDYLKDNKITEICVSEIWENALGYGNSLYRSRKDSNEIVLIMQNFEDWEWVGTTKREPNGFKGSHKYWKYNGFIEVDEKNAPF